jgi:hypothetical protein
VELPIGNRPGREYLPVLLLDQALPL